MTLDPEGECQFHIYLSRAVGVVQNLAESASRGEYTLCFLGHFLLATGSY